LIPQSKEVILYYQRILKEMILDLSKELDRNKFKTYANKLYSDGLVVELKKIPKKKSVSQNSYLYVCITLFGLAFGYSLEESKVVLKRGFGLYYEKGKDKFLKSIADIDSKETTDFIDYIRTQASLQGYYIPTADEYQNNRIEIDREINNNKEWM
jgi:hypothetical protein